MNEFFLSWRDVLGIPRGIGIGWTAQQALAAYVADYATRQLTLAAWLEWMDPCTGNGMGPWPDYNRAAQSLLSEASPVLWRGAGLYGSAGYRGDQPADDAAELGLVWRDEMPANWIPYDPAWGVQPHRIVQWLRPAAGPQ